MADVITNEQEVDVTFEKTNIYGLARVTVRVPLSAPFVYTEIVEPAGILFLPMPIYPQTTEPKEKEIVRVPAAYPARVDVRPSSALDAGNPDNEGSDVIDPVLK